LNYTEKLRELDLHIVAFDVPFPADYGGVIDVFYKAKSLSDMGLRIALHLFDYGRGRQKDLEKIAAEVHYYPRKNNLLKQLSSLPFIVKSRSSELLLRRLKADQAPILFEGLHSTYYLNHPDLANRNKIVRTHNVEHDYYNALSVAQKGWKKFYFKWEAKRLLQYEKVLDAANYILAISQSDQKYYEKYKAKVHLLFPFHPFQVEEHQLSQEDFALYHGNLAVAENQKAAEFLLTVFADLDYKLVIAGKNPRAELKQKIKQFYQVQLIENPNEAELKQLIQTAKVNCLPTFQATGVKLKLIRALIEGNNLLVNSTILEGTNLNHFCEIANTKEEWQQKLVEVFLNGKSQKEILQRQNAAASIFDNQKSAMLLKELCVPAQ